MSLNYQSLLGTSTLTGDFIDVSNITTSNLTVSSIINGILGTNNTGIVDDITVGSNLQFGSNTLAVVNDPTFTGKVTVNVPGTALIFECLQNDQTNLSVGNGEVDTLNNTLDDGSGNLLITGGITAPLPSNLNSVTIDSSTTPQFNVTNASNTYFAVNNASITTKNNTLDNGSGNMTIAGNLTLSSATADTMVSLNSSKEIDSCTIGTNLQFTTNTLSVIPSPSFLNVTDTSLNSCMVSANSSGLLESASIGTNLSFSGNTLSVVNNPTFSGEVNITNNLVINDQLVVNQIGTPTIPLFQVHDGYSEYLTVGSGTNPAVISTENNTLDDGSGNMSIAGSVTITTSNTEIFRCDDSSGTLLSVQSGGEVDTLNNVLDDSLGNMSLSGGLTTGKISNMNAILIETSTDAGIRVANPGGSSIYFEVDNLTGGAVTTLNNTLDDSTGNMIVAGSLTITGGLSVTTATTATAGSATLPPNPVGFAEIKINGTMYKIPYYNM